MAPFAWRLSTLLGSGAFEKDSYQGMPSGISGTACCSSTLNLEVIMIVLATPRIELCPANRAARITLHVLENRYRRTAGAAKYCWLVPFSFRPDCDRMIGERQVAILAGIVTAATFHLDGDDVSRPVIMLATGL